MLNARKREGSLILVSRGGRRVNNRSNNRSSTTNRDRVGVKGVKKSGHLLPVRAYSLSVSTKRNESYIKVVNSSG